MAENLGLQENNYEKHGHIADFPKNTTFKINKCSGNFALFPLYLDANGFLFHVGIMLFVLKITVEIIFFFMHWKQMHALRVCK